MKGLTYDSRALIAAERSERKMWALHKRALDRGVRPSVPAAALTEVYRSARQVNLSQMLAGCRIDLLEEATAKAAGDSWAVRGQSGSR
ncbi:MAG TPA: hypothetical protein VF060_18305 [Trebonia sp.]